MGRLIVGKNAKKSKSILTEHSGRLVDLRAYWVKIWRLKFCVVLLTNIIKTIHRIDFGPYFGRKYPLHALLSHVKLL